MYSLTLATLRTRWATYLGVFLTMVAATALITAWATLVESGIRGGEPPERLASADLVVTRDQSISERHGQGDDAYTVHADVAERLRLDDAIVSTLATLPGVVSATPEISFVAQLVGPDGRPLTGPDGTPSWGHAWQSAAIGPFTLTSGRAPVGSGDVVLDTQLLERSGLAVDDSATVVVAGEPHQVTIVGAADLGRPLSRQSAIFFNDAEAARHYDHPGQTDAVVVMFEPGAQRADVNEAVRAIVGDDATVLTGLDRGRAEFLDAISANSTLVGVSATIGGISLFVAGFVVAAMLALLVQQRQRELALLRAVAATPAQVRRMITLEMVTLGSVAAVVGLWPGAALAGIVSRQLSTAGILPRSFESPHGPIPGIFAVSVAVLISAVAGTVAGRRAAKVRPVEALSDATLEPPRLGVLRIALGLLAVAAGAAVYAVSLIVPPSIVPALVPALIMALLLATALFAPWLAAGGLRVVGLVSRVSRSSGHLARTHTTSFPRRSAAAIVPVVLVVAVSGITLFQQTTIGDETREQGAQRNIADQVIASGTSGLPPAIVGRIAASGDDVTAIGLKATTISAGPDLEPHVAQAVTPGELDQVLDLDTRSGSSNHIGANAIGLSVDLADELNAHLGETVDIHLGDGTRITPRVTVIFARARGFGDAILPISAVREHTTDRALETVLIRAEAASSVDHRAWSQIASTHPGARLGGVELVLNAESATADAHARFNQLLLGLVATFSLIALINTLVVRTASRSREFAQMRLVGVTRGQVHRMVTWEAFLTTILGCVIGGVVAVITLAPFATSVTGSPQAATPWVHSAAIVGATVGVAIATTCTSTWFATRTNPIDTVGTRE